VSRAPLLRALAALSEAPGATSGALAQALELDAAPTAAEHTDLFVLQLHPYASVHLGPEGMLGGDARDRVAGFLRTLEVVPPPEPDRLAVLLTAYAELVALDEAGATRADHARRVLLHEHIGSWVGRLLARAVELGSATHRRWAQLTIATLADELAALGEPPVLPAALREASALDDPRTGDTVSFVPALLAPSRSGLVLARADLARAAGEMGLGARVGERAYALRALLAQDATATLAWLASEAERQRGDLGAVRATGGPLVHDWWDARLTASARLLAGLAEDGTAADAPAGWVGTAGDEERE
jgi:TorA maturation chaperone TorD